VPGVSVRVLEAGLETTTDAEGRFAVAGLAPGTYTVQARRPGFVIERRDGVVVAAGAAVDVSFVLQPAPLTADEIAVHPSRVSLLREEPAAPFALSRDEILALPQLGGDVFRALSLLPGTTGNDVSAQFHVRGGRRDEVLVLLDGQELYEAYHLKDFDNALSVVAASGLAQLDLTTGAFPSSYGDRMGGVLDMSTLAPATPPRHRLSASVVDLQAETSGTAGERLGWHASARRGATDLAADLFGREENPSFWDLFGKAEVRPTAHQSLRASLLHSSDRLDFREELDGERRRFDTDYDTTYLWLTHQAVLSDRLFVDSALSGSRIARDRRGLESEEEKRFEVDDDRDLEVGALLQSWNLQAGPRHFLKAGVEGRRFEAAYDYASFREFESPFAPLRSEPRDGAFDFRDSFSDDYLGAYLSDRFRPLARLTLEAGARYDRHTLTGDGLWSPRVNLAWGLGGASVARLGWGHFHQSQRAYELAVEDGDTRFYPAERAEHWVAGLEHRFAGDGAGPLAGVRLEAFRRRVSDPRPRYESLFEPFENFHEGELDRFRFEPEESTAEGVELLLRGRAGSRADGWVSYAWSTSEDTLAGREVPRQIDQRHTVALDLNLRLSRAWDLNLAWRFHTGWPTTPVAVEERPGEPGEPQDPDEGEEGDDPGPEPVLVPVLGPVNGERLPDYHRLDLRLSRRFALDRGRLTAFLDVQNLYDRQNVAGYDLDLDEEARRIVADEELWPGFFASAGVTWEF
jgi:outer membrane receptor protein involved in Fe transport